MLSSHHPSCDVSIATTPLSHRSFSFYLNYQAICVPLATGLFSALVLPFGATTIKSHMWLVLGNNSIIGYTTIVNRVPTINCLQSLFQESNKKILKSLPFPYFFAIRYGYATVFWPLVIDRNDTCSSPGTLLKGKCASLAAISFLLSEGSVKTWLEQLEQETLQGTTC